MKIARGCFACSHLKKRQVLIAFIGILIVIVVLIFNLFFDQTKNEDTYMVNLITNGCFDSVVDGYPDKWQLGMWITNDGVSNFERVSFEDGTNAVMVENMGANDARYEQTVRVSENSIYKLSASIRAEGCDEDQVGANLSFLGYYGHSESVYDTNGQFEKVTLYAQTGDGQREATVCLRLGFYGSETTGRAYFTDVACERVDSVPIGVEVIKIFPTEQNKEITSSNTMLLGVILGMTCLIVWAILRYTINNKEESVHNTENTSQIINDLIMPSNHELKLNRKDLAVIFAITIGYALIGFFRLGANCAPQTGYVSSASDESVIIDLGKRHENFHLYYYGGISDTQFSVSTSDDGIIFSRDIDALFDRNQCFKWLAMRMPIYSADQRTVRDVRGGMLNFSGRYVRITFDGPGASLWEIGIVNENGTVIQPISVTSSVEISDSRYDAESLIDEQNTVPSKPSWYNSMYFDEIYHARTGYEHANSRFTYETTHPPLGKVMMSWCIRLLGMTPFSWRLAGAICGVLMIPAIYLLANQLFASKRLAVFSAILLSLDCMHYTQTRIATIDSFPVLFMIMMFFFMIRWMKMNFFYESLRKTLCPLALSGFFMGLAIASKWIGCYGAIGLAVMFFSRFIWLWRVSVCIQKDENISAEYKQITSCFARKGVITILACCVFFVAIPVLIYLLSYLPYLRAYGSIELNWKTLQRIWDAQVLMFDYHKNLVAEHDFASPWYEWPIIAKPMWFYQSTYPNAGKASSILTFGNPAVWWSGLICIVALMIGGSISLFQKKKIVNYSHNTQVTRWIITGFLSAYLPWVFVSRLTFIYHYFASVPWIILAISECIRSLGKRHERISNAIMILICFVAMVLFVAFFPLASGFEVSRSWCDAVNWFGNWMWY